MPVSSAALPGLERVPGKQNWIEKLPAPLRAAWHRSIIYRAAKHMAAKGMPVGMAIASANNWAEHICHTGDVKQWKGPQQVRPSSVAECCAARTLWNTMRAASKTDTSIPARDRRVLELAFERIDREAVELARRPGPIRRLRDLVRRAIVADHLLEFTPSTAEREKAAAKGQAMPSENGGGRFPIRNRTELQKAIRAVGRARPNTEEERRKVRRFIVKRARALNATDLIPGSWSSDGSLKS